MRILILLSLLALNAISCSKKANQVKIIEVQPKGEYSQVMVEDQNEAIERLNNSKQRIQAETAKLILENPNNYNPPVLYNLSNYLFNNNRKEKAAFWFYTGQLRARYDANRCNDKTAGQAVSVLNQSFGTQINEYGFEDLDNLESIVEEVVEYVRSNNEEYDNRWINLHGMGAFLNDGKELSKPKSDWAKIKSNTIADYWEGFNEAMQSMKE